jgi:hypothetical protein
MSHGVDRIPRPTSTTGRQSLNAAQFDALYRIARDMGCETIGYDDLEKWRNGTGTLPRRPLMIDFDPKLDPLAAWNGDGWREGIGLHLVGERRHDAQVLPHRFRIATHDRSRQSIVGQRLLHVGERMLKRAVGEFGATILVAGNIPGKTTTVSLKIYEAVQLGHDPVAYRLVVVCLLLSFAAVWISERLSRSRTE